MSLTPLPAYTPAPPTAGAAESQGEIPAPTATSAKPNLGIDAPSAAAGEAPYTPSAPE